MRVEKEIKEAERIIQWLDKKIDGLEISSEDRFRVAAGCLDMALEHHKSLVLLIANDLYGSAMALVRLVFESYIRGCWLAYCATEAQIRKFLDDKLDKEFFELIADIEKHEAFNAGTLSLVKETSWTVMNSFTHSGFMQIARRNTSTSIVPNYTDEELIDAIETGDSFSLLTAIAIADLAGDEKLAKEVFEEGIQYFEKRPNKGMQSDAALPPRR